MKLDDEPRFLTDAMLGKLTRWLRVLGFDTTFNPAQHDRALVAIADDQHRTLLTRDRHLITFLQPERGLLIQVDRPLQQLRQVVEECTLSAPQELFTRCILCNTPLQKAPPELIERVPAEASGKPETVLFCCHCRKLYWHGSHTERMREQLRQALPGWL